MTFTRVRIALIAALCGAVVLCGVGLWIVESRLVANHPGCAGTGSLRVSVSESVSGEPVLQRALDRVLSGLGCATGPSRDATANRMH
ncbi:hypothetical protein [Tsukamurella tyrosinosolvens]|uniref:hypothetical protein n=1 Tax=Tsukamurella tyrosinosolvens TaxID=57704 RepID=UPI00125FE60E|nr:hypothetical protein [Tsukamurella tyrosinosolvens]